MANNRIAVALLTLLCCSLLLTGCKDVEKEKALEEVWNLKAQLTKTESDLTQITSERDALKSGIETFKQTNSKLQVAADKVITLEEKTAKLIKERNLAVDKARNAQVAVEKLKGQLADQVQKALALEKQNKKLLQDTINKQAKIADAAEAWLN